MITAIGGVPSARRGQLFVAALLLIVGTLFVQAHAQNIVQVCDDPGAASRAPFANTGCSTFAPAAPAEGEVVLSAPSPTFNWSATHWAVEDTLSASTWIWATDAGWVLKSQVAFPASAASPPPAAPSGTAAVIRVHAGGSAYTDSAGNVWSADTGFNSSSYTVNWGSIPISGTSDPTLYQTERYGPNLRYAFALPNGTYQVNLYFAENYVNSTFPNGGIGFTVFSVQANGVTIVSNLDVFATVGAHAALMKTGTVTVTNGQLVLSSPTPNGWGVSAIEVTASSGGSTSTGPSSTTTAPPSNTSTDTLAPFPRNGFFGIGGNHRYPKDEWATYGTFMRIVVSAAYPSWEGDISNSPDRTLGSVVTGIKANAASGVTPVIVEYVDLNEQSIPPAPASTFPQWQTLIQNNNWWAYNTGTSGPKAVSAYNSTWGLVDMAVDPVAGTAYAGVDPTTGLRPYQRGGKLTSDIYINGVVSPYLVATNLDGFLLDNELANPNPNADYRRDGNLYDYAGISLAFRTGETDFHNWLRANWNANETAGANSIGSLCNGQLPPNDPSVAAPLNGANNLTVFEFALGYPPGGNAPTAEYSAIQLMSAYICADNLLGGFDPVVIVDHSDINPANGEDGVDSTHPWQATRYGYAFTAMRNGAWYGDTNGFVHDSDTFIMLDEMTGGSRINQYSWCGQPIDPPQSSAAWTAAGHGVGIGVWKREYQHCLAIWNPLGNGAVTISTTDLGGAGRWRYLNGSQAPSINNDAIVTGSISMADRDGLFLCRVGDNC